LTFKVSIFSKKFLIFNNIFQIICNWAFFVLVRFHHGLLFSWSLNWLFLNNRSWVLNNRFFDRGWFLNRFRVCLRRRFRIGGLLFFMSSFKCCFKSFNIFCRKN
jgi:hypothetical protein